jgi:hypothetical protein
VAVSATAVVSVTGVSGTGQVGSVTTTANANVFAVGVSAIGYIGFVTIWGRMYLTQYCVY